MSEYTDELDDFYDPAPQEIEPDVSEELPDDPAPAQQPQGLTAEELAEAVRSALAEDRAQAQAPVEQEIDYSDLSHDPFTQARNEAVQVIRLQESIVPSHITINGKPVEVPQQVLNELRQDIQRITDPGQLQALKNGGWADVVIKSKMYDLQSAQPAPPPTTTVEPVGIGAAYSTIPANERVEMERIFGKLTDEDIKKYGG